MFHWPVNLTPRTWQKHFLRAYHEADKKNYVLDVVPAAGKTTGGLAVAHDLFNAGRIRRLVVISHTDQIRSQWVAEAARWSIQLSTTLVPSASAWGALHGLSLTYQQVAAYAPLIRSLATKTQRPLVIFDEIHHVADDATWGDAVQTAFGDAYRRLLLSGTPFRHDDSAIAFVTYRRGRAVVDFSYGYADALRDGIVAPIFFPTIGGKARWRRGDKEFLTAFEEATSQQQVADVLNTAISTENKWLLKVLRDAHARLTELRQYHRDAGGLVICRDQAHAKAVAGLLKRITRKEPIVAISDLADASDRIDEFKVSNAPWLVAVRMVTEGVDIPRLRVGVYATNIATELFFRQAVGRLIRIAEGIEDQSAFLYIPRDPRLVQYAREIEKERQHVLSERAMAARLRQPHLVPVGPATSLFQALGAEALTGDVITGNETYSGEELQLARLVKQQAGMAHLPDEVVARLLRAANQVPRL